MFYAELNDGVRTMIETDAVFLADRSEAVGADKRIVHALRLKKGSEIFSVSEKMVEEMKDGAVDTVTPLERLISKGYEQCTAAEWFAASTENMTGDEAARFAEQAANS